MSWLYGGSKFSVFHKDQTYIADVVRIGSREQDLRQIWGEMGLELIFLPSSHIAFL